MSEKHLVEEVIEDVIIPGLRTGTIFLAVLFLMNLLIRVCGGNGFMFSPLSGYMVLFIYHSFVFLWKKGAFRK